MGAVNRRYKRLQVKLNSFILAWVRITFTCVHPVVLLYQKAN